ncbi:MAG: hypothetical protein KatS3mg027_2552 [Bacteroidia bacterium]|nr:MAG: hypothetical protein KatS3mg027_2552 [Bacteroidia bacterium]
MFKQKTNIKYILIIIAVVLLIISVYLVIRLFPPVVEYLPILPTKPKSIFQTRKIYDLNAGHNCQISPFSQSIAAGEDKIFEVTLQPSYNDSPYELEFGSLPKDVFVEMPIQRGRGDDHLYFKVHRLEGQNRGSFTITLAYHEYQMGKFQWLTNYCLLNLVLR